MEQFGVGPLEAMTGAVVALLIGGPELLPRVAQTVENFFEKWVG